MSPTIKLLSRANKTMQKRADRSYRELLLKLCRLHGSFECAVRIESYVLNSQYADLLQYADSLSAQMYADATTHYVANQFASLIRKYPWVPSVVETDPEGTARNAWRKAEHKCKRVNTRFRMFRTFRSPQEETLNRMRGFIRFVLGDEPNMESIYAKCDYTAGAALGVHGNATNLGRKLSAKITCTPGALGHFLNAAGRHASLRNIHCPYRVYPDPVSGEDAYVSCWDSDAWKLALLGKDPFSKENTSAVQIVTHNKIGFVPKTAKTLRSIAVEPLANAFLQKGIGDEMRKLLNNRGIDLSDQTRNQYFAKFGSEDWNTHDPFCTIDLSAASDSLALEVCRMLLPDAWYSLLKECRSPEYDLNGRINKYEKFVSMGNGFCFPLETLIFAAACAAAGCGVPRRDFVVYGDDIIVRKDRFDAVVSNLTLLGFTVNHRKTFSEGPFRESCGADWYEGLDVRPYTLDHALDSVQNIFKFLNLTRRSPLTASFFAGTYSMVIEWIPSQLRFFRPIPGPADSAIDLQGLEFIVSPLISRKGDMWRWREILTTPRRDKIRLTEPVRIACFLRGDATLFLRRRTTSRIVRKHGG